MRLTTLFFGGRRIQAIIETAEDEFANEGMIASVECFYACPVYFANGDASEFDVG